MSNSKKIVLFTYFNGNNTVEMPEKQARLLALRGKGEIYSLSSSESSSEDYLYKGTDNNDTSNNYSKAKIKPTTSTEESEDYLYKGTDVNDTFNDHMEQKKDANNLNDSLSSKRSEDYSDSFLKDTDDNDTSDDYSKAKIKPTTSTEESEDSEELSELNYESNNLTSTIQEVDNLLEEQNQNIDSSSTSEHRVYPESEDSSGTLEFVVVDFNNELAKEEKNKSLKTKY